MKLKCSRQRNNGYGLPIYRGKTVELLFIPSSVFPTCFCIIIINHPKSPKTQTSSTVKLQCSAFLSGSITVIARESLDRATATSLDLKLNFANMVSKLKSSTFYLHRPKMTKGPRGALQSVQFKTPSTFSPLCFYLSLSC